MVYKLHAAKEPLFSAFHSEQEALVHYCTSKNTPGVSSCMPVVILPALRGWPNFSSPLGGIFLHD